MSIRTLTLTVTALDGAVIETTEHPTMRAADKHLQRLARRKGWFYSNPANNRIDARNWAGRFVKAHPQNLGNEPTGTYAITAVTA